MSKKTALFGAGLMLAGLALPGCESCSTCGSSARSYVPGSAYNRSTPANTGPAMATHGSPTNATAANTQVPSGNTSAPSTYVPRQNPPANVMPARATVEKPAAPAYQPPGDGQETARPAPMPEIPPATEALVPPERGAPAMPEIPSAPTQPAPPLRLPQ